MRQKFGGIRLAKAAKFTVSLVALGLAATGLTACNTAEVAEKPADCSPYDKYGKFDGKSVSVYSSIVDKEALSLEQAWKDFALCTGITVKYTGTKEFETQLFVRTKAGAPPDIAFFPQPGLLAEQVSKGRVKPAPAKVEQLVDQNWTADWKKYGTVNNTFYAAPLLANVKGYVWYSPKIFQQNGWEIPKTWEEMMALSQKIAQQGSEPKAWCAGFESGEASGWPGTDWVEGVVVRQAGPEVYDQWVEHQIPFDDPRIVEAFETTGAILKNTQYVNGGFGGVESISSTAFAKAGQPVLDGKCAMYYQGSFQAANWPKSTKVAPDGDVWAFIAPPMKAEDKPAITGGGEFVGAYKDTPEVQAFQEYLATADFANARVKQGGAVSANKGLDINNAQTELDKNSVRLLQNPEVAFRFDGSDNMPGAVGSGTFWKGMIAWIDGKSSQDVTREIEASWPQE